MRPQSEGHTIAQALRSATLSLQEGEVDSPRLDAEVLLAHHLGLTRSQLLARTHFLLSPELEEGYGALVERRRRREPVAYITGCKEFYGLEFRVTPEVLIPRPETEVLVEVALVLARQGRSPIAEVGTGSGAVAIALARNLPGVKIYATDSSPSALRVAEENRRCHQVSLSFLQGDLLEPLPEAVALIVANLPYLSRQELEEAQPEVARYEPREALDGGEDGLKWHRRLFAQAPEYLLPEGAICLEMGADQAQAVSGLAREEFPQAKMAVVKDLAGLDRVAVILT